MQEQRSLTSSNQLQSERATLQWIGLACADTASFDFLCKAMAARRQCKLELDGALSERAPSCGCCPFCDVNCPLSIHIRPAVWRTSKIQFQSIRVCNSSVPRALWTQWTCVQGLRDEPTNFSTMTSFHALCLGEPNSIQRHSGSQDQTEKDEDHGPLLRRRLSLGVR